MKKNLMIVSFFASLVSSAQSKPVDKTIQAGNDFYKKQQFAKATEEYNKAVATEPSNSTAKFNQANSLYKQDKKVEAVQIFATIAAATTEKKLKSEAYYNKGVILSQQKNLEESIETYKNALRNNSKDIQARENLQKALLELKKKNADKKKENDQQKKKKEDQKKQPQSKMSPKEAEQRLKLLQQKEKEVQQRVQKEKTKTGGSQTKDW
jgi:Ca-activated chloride channel homolog